MNGRMVAVPKKWAAASDAPPDDEWLAWTQRAETHLPPRADGGGRRATQLYESLRPC